MKLVVAIMSREDSDTVSRELSKIGFSSTRSDGVGGFLQIQRQILLCGVDDMRVRDVLRIIGEFSHSHERDTADAVQSNIYTLPGTVKVGGSVVFVLDVDQFHKL